MKLRYLYLCILLAIQVQGAMAQVNKNMEKLFNSAQKAIAKNRLHEADSLARLYCSLCTTEKDQLTYEYSYLLSVQASNIARKGNVNQAIQMGEHVIDIRKKSPNCERQHLATSLNELAIYYSYKGAYDKAITLEREAIKILTEMHREKDINYSISLTNLATFLSYRGQEGDYLEAVELGEKGIKNINKNSNAYVNALNSLVVYYSQMGNIEKADKLSKEALKKAEKIYGENSYDYAILLNNMGIRFANLHNFKMAIEYSSRAKNIYDRTGGKKSLNYANLIVNLASFYAQVDNYTESIALLEEARPLLLTIVGNEHADYIRCISELATAYNHIGKSEKAEEFNQVIRQPEHNKQKSVVYGLALSKEADIKSTAGDFEKAIDLEKAALQIFEERKDTINIGLANMHLCNFYSKKKEYEKAIKAGNFAIFCFKQKQNPAYYAQALNAVSIAQYNSDHYEIARNYCAEAIHTHDSIQNNKNSVYAKTLANLALYHFMCDSVNTAISTAEKALEQLDQMLGYDHPDNASLHYNLASFYNRKGDAQQTAEHYQKALDIQQAVIRSNFSYKTAIERELFWDTKRFLFKAAPTLAFIYPENDSLIAAAYNTRLFTQGLLLNSEINFRNLLLQSNDSLLLNKYERLEALYHEIEFLYKLTTEQRGDQLKKAQKEAQILEKTLVKECKEYGDFMSNLDVSYQNVAKKLEKEDVAVEFLDIYVEGQGTTYIALYLRKDWKYPRMKILFSQKDLDQLTYSGQPFSEAIKHPGGINRVYNDPHLGKLVWGELTKEWKDVKNIYFSPTGIFYQLGIEYLTLDQQSTISDQYNCYRLSSTRLVGALKETKAFKSASIYGGLNYDVDTEELTTLNKDMAWADFMFADERSLTSNLLAVDSLISRGGVGFLMGTLVEADSIGAILMQNDIPTDMFLENFGTEESFKALSGRNRSLLHIATHGFYLTPKDLANQDIASLFKETTQRDQSLSYAGLLLAGANNALTGKKLPDGVENGILTAREISMLDFRNLELVVLSACKTGVGEIKEDGVFGLQRGFKKAGAKTLLMSLWNVNDEATQSMMIAFYSALIQGEPKHEAFRKAQQKLRNGKFKDPFYWASFIILDSLD